MTRARTGRRVSAGWRTSWRPSTAAAWSATTSPREQVAYAREMVQRAACPLRTERLSRGRSTKTGQFDRVVSVGLCEHIGYKNYRGFLELAHAQLKHRRAVPAAHHRRQRNPRPCTDAWIDKYIFPNGMIPSIAQLGKAMEDLWVMEDWHNFGPDYDRTLMAWWDNFDRGWPTLRAEVRRPVLPDVEVLPDGSAGASVRAACNSGRSCCRRATSRRTRPSGEPLWTLTQREVDRR